AREGRVTLVMPQVEMGQGTYTSMSMLIAEELEVNLERVTLEAAPPDDRLYANALIGSQVTGGSVGAGHVAAVAPCRRCRSNHADHSRRASLARGPDDLPCRKRRGDSPTDGSAAHLRSARRLGGEAAGAG